MWLLAMLAGRRSQAGEPAVDQRLLERMASGDGAALRTLYDQYARAVFSLAVRILRSQQDAEDLVQEVFVQAWRQAIRYDPGRGTVAAWLLMQTRSRAIDQLRSRRARPEGTDADGLLAQQRDPAAGADVEVVRLEQADAVRRALDDLPHPQRAALELAYYDGLTHVEIAERLEEPLGTVKTRIRQGLLRLRDALTTGGGTA
jgi:RNA polymerase sigma-70 factor (ECF subfamily)